MKLTTYFRSTAAYRIRIALNLKGIEHELLPLNLFTGEQQSPEFLNINPNGLIPVLQIGDECLTQSMAILEYLEEAHPKNPLLPQDQVRRAHVRALAHSITSDIHPLNNLRVQKYLGNEMSLNDDAKLQWYQHWVAIGFAALETRLEKSAGAFCFGGDLSFADVCLIPQVYNAHRFNCPMTNYPTINRINQNCLKLAGFAKATPERQGDAQ